MEALFWAKLDLLTNIPWIAALEEQEASLHLVMRKTPLNPTSGGGVPKLIAEKSADVDTCQ